MNTNEERTAWREVFLEIALRAIRRIHLDYGIWGIGQNPLDTKVHLENFNAGPGIQLAMEETVCAAITQEFINSRFINGNFYKNLNRFYEIDREITFEKKDKTKRIDIFIDRYKMSEDKKHLLFYRYPVLIEAKRAHYFIPRITEGDVEKEDVDAQVCKIKDDIKYLIEVKGEIVNTNGNRKNLGKYKGNLKGAFLYTLFWGTFEKEKSNSKIKLNKNRPEYFIEQLKLKKDHFWVKWLPLKWTTPNKPVNQWLWIVLAEIDPKDNGDSKENESERYWFKYPNK